MTTIMVAAALGILTLVVVVWLISVAVKDASIVDIIWGFGFVVVAWVSLFAGEGSARHILMVALVTIWGLRLTGYLAWRNLGKGEDFRYQAMRRRIGDRFWIVSLVTVYLLQGALMWLVSLPVQASAGNPADIGWLGVVGAIVWAVGLAFETIGDSQLARFKADPATKGQVMDQGLWRYTRHPNYFGDFCVWWGLFLIVAASAPWAVVGPIVMSILLMRVSGVTLLEKGIGKRRPGYAEYVRRTSAFFPRPPKA